MIPTAQRNTRQSGAGLKILSAGSTLYGLRPCAEMFGRDRPFGPVTEIKSWHGKGVVYAGAIPDEMQIVLPYGAAVLRRTQERELAHALLAFLATSVAREQFLASGVE